MILDKENREFIKNHALEDTPKECCGFLYSDEDTGLVKTKKARNIAKEKNISFSVDTLDYFKTSNLGQIKAIYHSHTNGNPDFSLKDKEDSLKHKIDFVLYDLTSDTFKVFRHEHEKIEILEKKFKWGQSDCISLVQDYLNKSVGYNLLLPKSLNDRDSKWRAKSKSFVEETFELNKKNLIKVSFNTIEDLKQGDILCFSIKDNVDHFGVYISNNNFLHHKIGRRPNCEKIDKYFKNLTQVYRYNNGR